MALEKIQTTAPKVPELIMQALKGAIETEYIKIGEEMPSERDMAEALGVGRGSLRECLAILEFMGAIESRGNRKVLLRDADYITKVTSWVEITSGLGSQETFLEFRRVIECGIAELACRRATDEDLAAIRETLRAMEENPCGYEGDVAFHDALAEASHNTMLASTIRLVNNLIADVRMRFWDLPVYQEKTIMSHRAIYEAVAAHDATRAQLEMILHLEIVKEFSEKYPERRRTMPDETETD